MSEMSFSTASQKDTNNFDVIRRAIARYRIKPTSMLMKKSNVYFKTNIAAVSIVVLLACFAVLPAADAGTAPASPLNVNVVNTPTVNVGNTPTVTVSNFPATQPVSGSVLVANDTANPVPLRDVDNPASQPFAFNGFSFWSVNSQTTGVSFTVPAGKRLVIEQVSAQANVTSIAPTKQVTLYVSATAGGTVAAYYFTGTDVGEFAGTGRDWVVASSQTRSYADAGTTVSITAFRSYTDNYSDTINFYLSGYLVNVP